MAPPLVNDDQDILDAAEKIEAEGKRVTGYALARILGRGRPSALESRYLELTASRQKNINAPSLPTETEETIAALGSEITNRLNGAVSVIYASLKKQTADRIEELDKQSAQTAKELRDELDTCNDERTAEKAAKDLLQKQLNDAQTQITKLQSEIDKRDGQITSMGRVNVDLQDKMTALQAQNQKIANEKTSLANKLDEAKAAMAEAKAEAKDAKKEALDASARAAAAEATARQVQVTSDKATTDLATANKTIGQLETLLTTLKSELDAKTKELDAIKAPPVPAQEAATNKH